MRSQCGSVCVRILTVCLPIAGILMLAPIVLASSGAEGHGDGAMVKDFIYRCVNFCIMVAGLGYLVAKPIRSALAQRQQKIEESLSEARNGKALAEQSRQELEEKLATANAEMQQVVRNIEQGGEVERERIQAQAQELTESIAAEVESIACREKEAVVQEVKQQAVQMAVQIAEEILHKELSDEDQAQLVDRYLKQVGEAR